HIGVAQQFTAVDGRLGKGHTDACGQQDVTVGDLERFGGDRPPQPFGQVHHLLGARTAFHQDREFVPAPARQGRGGVQFTAEYAGRLTQQVVATYVPRRVVDGGETVQVQEDHRDLVGVFAHGPVRQHVAGALLQV